MKPLATPADKAKAAGLGIGCLLTFGFVVFRLMNMNQGGAAAAPGAVVSISGSGSAASAASGGAPTEAIPMPAGVVAQHPADNLIDVPVYFPTETRNPFRKAVAGYSGPELAVVASNDESPPPVHRRSRRSGPGDFPVNPMGGNLGGPSVEVRPEADSLQVMGVTLGPIPVADVTVAGKEYVVEKGGVFGHGFQVKEVSTSQVVIVQHGQTHIIRVGTKPLSSQPQPPPDAPPANPPPAQGASKSGAASQP